MNGTVTNYESKKDGWVVAALWLVIGYGLVGGLANLFGRGRGIGRWLRVELHFDLAAVTWWILNDTYYTVDDEAIGVKAGPFGWSIPLERIEEVRPRRMYWASAALSADRLEIRQAGGSVGTTISPADREGFLADVAARAGHLVRVGDGLVAGDQKPKKSDFFEKV